MLGVTESHGESLDAVNESAPPPVFVTVTEMEEGFEAAPCDVPKESVVWDSARFDADIPLPPPPHAAKQAQAAINIVPKIRFISRASFPKCLC